MNQLTFSSSFNICIKICILQQIIATVMLICIPFIHNKRSMLRFQTITAAPTEGGLPVVWTRMHDCMGFYGNFTIETFSLPLLIFIFPALIPARTAADTPFSSSSCSSSFSFSSLISLDAGPAAARRSLSTASRLPKWILCFLTTGAASSSSDIMIYHKVIFILGRTSTRLNRGVTWFKLSYSVLSYSKRLSCNVEHQVLSTSNLSNFLSIYIQATKRVLNKWKD